MTRASHSPNLTPTPYDNKTKPLHTEPFNHPSLEPYILKSRVIYAIYEIYGAGNLGKNTP